MNNACDISFLLPVYNVAPYIKDAINSILVQKLEKFNYEIICVDDASTDNSLQVLEELKEKNESDNIRVYSNTMNRGVSYSRNYLLKLAKGEYISFVDPDDVLGDNNDILLKAAYKSNADFVYGNYSKITGSDHFFEKDNTEAETQSGQEITCFWKNPPIDREGNGIAAVWSGIFKRRFLIDNAIVFDPKVSFKEDTLFFHDFLSHSPKIYKINVDRYYYRQREGSLLHSVNSEEKHLKLYKSSYYLYKHMEAINQRYSEGCDNKNYLAQHIEVIKRDIVTNLAGAQSSKYIAKQLKALKAEGVYPYKNNKEDLFGISPKYKAVLYYLVPIEPFFWILHGLFIISYKRQKYMS